MVLLAHVHHDMSDALLKCLDDFCWKQHKPPVYLSSLTFKDSIVSTMINAVLVFNNNGQPRLTKFYTQLVRLPLSTHSPHSQHLRTPQRNNHSSHRPSVSSQPVPHRPATSAHSRPSSPFKATSIPQTSPPKSPTDTMPLSTSSSSPPQRNRLWRC